MRKLIRSLLAVGALAGLAACGTDVSITEPNDVIITGAPTTAISVGAKVQLSTNIAVTWASSAANVASVDATGLVTAVAAGTASITATSTANTNKKATVTITVTAPGVASVTVSPPNAILAVGQTLQVVANVTADPGVARTVTWTSSNTAVATVNAAGVVTAVANGTASITATSTANTQVAGSMALTVRNPTAAVVNIASVNAGAGTPGAGLPVNLAAVTGQIDVLINIDPGDFIAQKVDLLVDGVVVGTQTFSAQLSQQLSLSHAFPDMANAVSTITISFNTAAFNPTTGVVLPINLNGTHIISARLTVVGGGTGNSAIPSLSVTFVNPNTWISSLAFTGTTATATGTAGTAAGLAFKRGGITVSVIPVIYNAGQAIVAAGSVVRFGSFCDASGTGQRNVTITGTTAPFTAVFPQTVPTGGSITNTVANYEFSPTACNAGFPGGELPTLTAVDNAGNTIFASVPPAPAPGIRLDNNAPGVPQFAANPNGRENGWINATVGLTGANALSLTSNNWLINGTADQGIGGGAITAASYLRFLRVGDGTAGTVAAANAATASNTPTLPAPTVANNSLCAVATARDELGNESALSSNSTTCLAPPAASFAGVGTGTTNLRFGVDIANPTIAYDVSSVAANARLNGATFGGEFVVTVADTGAVGNSGMLAGTPVKMSVIRREANGIDFATAPTDCVVGTLNGALTICNITGTGIVGALPLKSTAITGQTINGFYTDSAAAFDAAGNSTAIPVRVAAFDNVPATATNPAVPATITGSFSAASFLNDNLSIRDYFWTVTYATALITPATVTIAVNPTVVDVFNAATLNNINFGVNATINTYLGLQNGQGATPVAYPGAANLLSTLNLFVRDQTQAAYTGPASSPVAPTVPAAAGVSVTNFTGAFVAATSNGTICAGTLVAGCGVTPTSTNFTATATGATATFNNPFTRVDFYAANTAGTNLILIGSAAAGSATLVDNGATRVWTYTLPMTAASLYTTLGGVSPAVVGPVNVYAFGASPNGPVALVSAAITETINP